MEQSAHRRSRDHRPDDRRHLARIERALTSLKGARKTRGLSRPSGAASTARAYAISPHAGTGAAIMGASTVGVRPRAPSRRRNSLMTSSTTTRLAATSDAGPPLREGQRRRDQGPCCRNPIEVAATIARSAIPYRRSCVGPGTASRSKIVFRCSRASSPAARWKSDNVVTNIVEATRAPYRGSPNYWYATRVPIVITAPWTHRRTQLALESTGAPTGRGGRRMSPWAVEPERDRDGDVDDHIEPQDLDRVQGDPAGDAKDAGADEDRDVGDEGRTSGTGGTSGDCRRARVRTRRRRRSWRSCRP